MTKVLLIDLSSAYLPPPMEYRDLFRLRLKAEDMIKGRWNPYLRGRGAKTYSRGLLSIAASLERAGHQVAYKHCGFSEDCMASSAVQDAEIVGITCVTPTFSMTIDVLRKIKCLNPDILAVIGGSHVTYLAEDVVARYNPLVDVVVRGEGEITMTEIANHPHNLERIKGITYHALDQLGNISIHHNLERETCKLAELPQPAYHLLPFALSHYSHNIMTSRGCVFKCAYCVDGQYFAKFRHHPVGKIVDELKYIAGRAPKGTLVHFCDSVFDIDKNYVSRLINSIEEAALDLKFSCDLRASVVDEESIELMRSAGFIKYCIGVETSDDSVLAKHKQDQTFQDAIDACKLVRSVDGQAFIKAYWITGLPRTSIRSLQDEAEVMKSLIQESIVNIIGNKLFVPYPGTPIFDHAEQFGLIIRHRNWSEYIRYGRPVYDLDTSISEILFDCFLAQEEAVLKAYLGVLGIGLAELDGVVPSDYLYRQCFGPLPLE